MTFTRPRLIQWLRWSAQLVFIIGATIFIMQYLGDQWEQIRADPPEINWGLLVLSQIGLTIGLGLLPFGGAYILRDLNANLPPLIVWRAFYLANIAKYLPGSIWALPGRAFLYQRAGISADRSVAAVFWEVVLMIVSTGMLGLLALPLLEQALPETLFTLLGIGIIVGFLVLFSFVYWERFGKFYLRLPGFSKAHRFFNERNLFLTPRQITDILSAYLVAWIIIGVSFSGMVFAVSPNVTTIRSVELTGLYAGAWLVGFLVIIAPGGIGVRDFLLTVGLSVFLGDPLPAIIAVIARIAWTLAEITGVIIVSVVYGMSKKRGKL